MIKIRKARRRDLDQIYTIERLCFREAPFSRRAVLYHILNNLVICAEINDFVVGYMCFSPLTKTKKRRIYSIAVNPSQRKKGIARALMAAAEKKTKARHIYLEVDETNVSAIKLYESFGYTVFGRYENYYGETAALRMKKLI